MAVCRYMVTCPKWPECRHGGFTARDTLLPGSHRASAGVFPSVHGVSGHTETGCIPHHGHGVLGTASVGVARSRRVGVPSIPRVVSSGWWVCAGVIRTASDACFGSVYWGVRPRESWGVRWGWGGAGPPVVVCPSWVWVVAFAVVSFSSVPWSPLPPLPGSWVVSCPHVVSLPASCPCECLPSVGTPPCPLA